MPVGTSLGLGRGDPTGRGSGRAGRTRLLLVPLEHENERVRVLHLGGEVLESRHGGYQLNVGEVNDHAGDLRSRLAPNDLLHGLVDGVADQLSASLGVT